jgi:hypothetical protein
MSAKEKNARFHLRRSLFMAPLGLVLIGLGICLVAEGAVQKYNGADTWQWVLFGTFALVVLNSGVSIFGGAVVHRSNYERLQSESES